MKTGEHESVHGRPLSKAEAYELVNSLTWTYAKTMPSAPQWYVVRDRDLDSDQFEALARYIQSNGSPGRWGSRPRSTVLDDGRILEGLVCCDIGEHRYWAMGLRVEADTVINREEVATSTVRFIELSYLERRPELSEPLAEPKTLPE